MQYCRRCKAWIENPSRRCPLCQGVLEGEPEPEGQLFPDVTRTTSGMEFGFRVFTFVCVALAVVGCAANMIFLSQVFWGGFVAVAVGCMWVLTAVGLRKRRNLLKNTLWQMVLLSGIFLLWDFLTGYRGWSLEYAIPIAILLVFPILTVMVKVMNLPAVYYMIYYILTCSAGILQLLLLPVGILKMEIPCIVCGAVSCLVLAGLVIFQGKSFWDEVKKKTHM